MAELSFLAKAIVIMAAFAVLDYVYARYTVLMAAKKMAAIPWAMAIPLLTGFITIEYVEERWLLLPTAIGAAIGTYLGIRSPEKMSFTALFGFDNISEERGAKDMGRMKEFLLNSTNEGYPDDETAHQALVVENASKILSGYNAAGPGLVRMMLDAADVPAGASSDLLIELGSLDTNLEKDVAKFIAIVEMFLAEHLGPTKKAA